MKKSLKKSTEQLLNDFEIATLNLGAHFLTKYFGKNVSDTYWIGNDVTGTLYVNDYFFDLGEIRDFLKYKYSKDDMFNYYDHALAIREKGGFPMPIRDWKFEKRVKLKK